VFLLALHLRPDHDEVQHREHQDERQEAHQARFGATGTLREGVGNERHVGLSVGKIEK
jgi:hypothetical protein